MACCETAGELDDPIQYAVVVSLEVGSEVGISIYQSIRERLREPVQILT